jgi:cytochrome c-type biogenesis protein CcmH/NrfG
MELFKGLYSYEVVLLILGIVFFVLLAVLLTIQILKEKDYKSMMLGFIFPVIMIGFPGIQKITYENGKVELDKVTRAVIENPQNEEAKEELAEQVQIMESRATRDPQALVTLAKANLALGDTAKARESVNRAIDLKPDNIPAKSLIKTMRRPQR